MDDGAHERLHHEHGHKIDDVLVARPLPGPHAHAAVDGEIDEQRHVAQQQHAHVDERRHRQVAAVPEGRTRRQHEVAVRGDGADLPADEGQRPAVEEQDEGVESGQEQQVVPGVVQEEATRELDVLPADLRQEADDERRVPQDDHHRDHVLLVQPPRVVQRPAQSYEAVEVQAQEGEAVGQGGREEQRFRQEEIDEEVVEEQVHEHLRYPVRPNQDVAHAEVPHEHQGGAPPPSGELGRDEDDQVGRHGGRRHCHDDEDLRGGEVERSAEITRGVLLQFRTIACEILLRNADYTWHVSLVTMLKKLWKSEHQKKHHSSNSLFFFFLHLS